MANNDFTLIILAGGDGTRMRPANLITPKPLLAIYDEPLLIRQIRQANEAGISKILVSTNLRDHTHIKQILSLYDIKAKVLENKKHKEGSLPALNFAIEKTSTPKILMSFADIYFFNNPFPKFISINKHSLGISKAFNERELSFGGIVSVKESVIQKIVEMPIKNNTKGYRWNGLALFDHIDRSSLKEFLKDNKSNSPEGNFFEYLRTEKKIDFSGIECSDFINVNDADNLLVAAIYRLSEIEKDKRFLTLADQTRNLVLKNAKYEI